ncbi:sucrase ferredoxin [Leptolyngbya sp. NK1-12]|uniref:Sucrase ferredoxin n=1 Tax=Leptolyngbya sp. NK1-12 TaxID=2547451 RepID=A0AA96WIS1_9CYAN|nr:sucrase ferredoxin [Leptolyngbya sp. NK1-12]
MAKFFCAEASRQANEDIIGSGTPYATYVLIEYPMPWAFEAMDSAAVPQNLRDLEQAVRQAKLSVRFLLIAPQQRKQTPQTKLIIYQQEHQPFVGGYRRSEWDVDQIEQVADIVKRYLAGEVNLTGSLQDKIQDILVCTHGMHDQCCAKYGLPFYRQALATVSELKLDSSVRVWKTSHFGGHRFAPTAIVLPDGRYYGALNPSSLRVILTRTGDIQTLRSVYRGWGILPTPLQVLERELMLKCGWDWFNYKLSHTILQQSEKQDWMQVELLVEQPDGTIYTYRAELTPDQKQTLCLKGSCNASNASKFVKYRVDQLHLRTVLRPEEFVKPIRLSA